LFIFYKLLHSKYESSLILYFKLRAYVNAANVIENLSYYLRRSQQQRKKIVVRKNKRIFNYLGTIIKNESKM
jgi:hypothetical protein